MQYGSFQSRLNKFKLEVNINYDDVYAADRVFFLKQIFILILSSLIFSQQRLLSYNYVCVKCSLRPESCFSIVLLSPRRQWVPSHPKAVDLEDVYKVLVRHNDYAHYLRKYQRSLGASPCKNLKS